MKLKSLALFAMLMPVTAFAIMHTGVQPAMVGLELGATQAYIGLTQNPNGCMNNGVYFVAPSFVDAKAAFNVAMIAKATGKTLRIDYTGGNGALCFGVGIYVE